MLIRLFEDTVLRDQWPRKSDQRLAPCSSHWSPVHFSMSLISFNRISRTIYNGCTEINKIAQYVRYCQLLKHYLASMHEIIFQRCSSKPEQLLQFLLTSKPLQVIILFTLGQLTTFGLLVMVSAAWTTKPSLCWSRRLGFIMSWFINVVRMSSDAPDFASDSDTM